MNFALAASKSPSQVIPEHHEEVRNHYSSREFADILAIVAPAGWLNRWNDSSAVVTDQESVDWAKANLTQVGWKLGRHEGEAGEQRLAHPFSEAMRGKSPFARK